MYAYRDCYYMYAYGAVGDRGLLKAEFLSILLTVVVAMGCQQRAPCEAWFGAAERNGAQREAAQTRRDIGDDVYRCQVLVVPE